MQQHLSALIVDDEGNSRAVLSNMLKNFCEGIEILQEVDSVASAVNFLKKGTVDIVFLDIEMPEENGFKLLEYIPQPNFEIIFTTAYNQYAVQAFRMSAIDYLLKPIDLEELRLAIQKVKERKGISQDKDKLEALKNNLNNVLKKLALPTSDGYYFVEIDQIIRCEADSNYTKFYLNNQKSIIVYKTLKLYDEILSNFNFFRINRSNLINLNYIQRFIRQKNATVIMDDGTTLTLPDSRKEDFLKMFERI